MMDTKTDIVHESQKQNIERLEEAPPLETQHNKEQTKTRFSGQKNLADFFDTTTQIIEAKVHKCNEICHRSIQFRTNFRLSFTEL